jgi:hypothetical protein
MATAASCSNEAGVRSASSCRPMLRSSSCMNAGGQRFWVNAEYPRLSHERRGNWADGVNTVFWAIRSRPASRVQIWDQLAFHTSDLVFQQ